AGLLGVLVVIGGGWRCGWRQKVDAVIFLFGCDRWRLELLLPVVNGDGEKVATVAVVGDGQGWQLMDEAVVDDGERAARWRFLVSPAAGGLLLLLAVVRSDRRGWA
ncbi:hypothetical protein Dimus_027256, partial [Dionaea muscipula]